jgi:vitamin B12 transporter
LVRNTNIGGYFGDRGETNTSASGLVAATVGPAKGFSFTGQVARGSRDPRLSDMYYRGPTGRGYITGNPDLSPETSLQFDLGVHYSSGPMRMAVYGYRYEITNLIERYQEATDFYFFRNRGKARLRGVEMEMQAALGRGLTAEVNGQLSDGKAVDDGTPLDDLSPGSADLVLRQQILGKGQMFVRAAAYGKLDQPGPNEQMAPHYTLVDMGASWSVSSHLELRGTGRNLFNASYHASPVSRWVYGPGRSWSLTAAVRF